MDSETRQRIDDLEYRLERYHELLIDSIAQRDRLALDAAWGAHAALYTLLAMIAALYMAHKSLGDSGWLSWLAFAATLLLVPAFVNLWSNSYRMKEVDQLAKLPDWQSPVR